MRLLRLHVSDFAAIVKADIEFGRGLNVLYGPNDLGKSTLVDSIRLALLLPHTSTHIEQFVPWTGAQHPLVDLTFETEAQRIWRVRKVFGKSGSSTLLESRNGVDFEETARGRQVDARLREILRWGIPEPGGAGAARGVPLSFLATALLSTQAHVGAILDGSLEDDTVQSGRERIAAALQSVAQDPVFTSLLRRTQERRDEAFTEKGAKKTSRDSPFKRAAERLRALQEEKEQWQRIVEESQSVENSLRDLTAKHANHEERVAVASDQLGTVELLSGQAMELATTAEQVRQAREAVSRIQAIDASIAAAEQSLMELARQRTETEEAVAEARRQRAQADAALEEAIAMAQTAVANPQMTNIVARQGLELRRSAAVAWAVDAQQQIDVATAAQQNIDAVAQAEREQRDLAAAVEQAAGATAKAMELEKRLEGQLRRMELLDYALAVRTADDKLAAAENVAARMETLRSRLELTRSDCRALETRRADLAVPTSALLAAIRRLAIDLASARAALDVGLVVTVAPHSPIALRLQKDGVSSETPLGAGTIVIEANTRVDLDLVDVATVTVQGGRLEAQEKVVVLERRWAVEAAPHLQAAAAVDVEALGVKVAEAQELDSSISAKETELRSLEEQMGILGDPEQVRREASEQAKACRNPLGSEPLEPLLDELSSLGHDQSATLRRRKESTTKEIAEIRNQKASHQGTQTVAEERLRIARSRTEEAIQARDAALRTFPDGVAPALKNAQAALTAATEEQKAVAIELASLEERLAADAARVEGTVGVAREAADEVTKAVDAAEKRHEEAINDHASQSGSIEQLRRLRQLEDLEVAERGLQAAIERHSSLPVPERTVEESEVTAARQMVERAKFDLATIEGEIQKAHGALEQVGGAVARERLHELIQAYEAAERHEREIESEFEAWKLLLETMKEADAAQASNLGQVLAPAVASRFEALTEKRYESVRLSPQLATEGVVVRGTVRPAERMSVGTREQLSTLYRLSLAEYLGTTVVLDDQLVQSDDTRMDWFRDLLIEKANAFQMVVLTCRPGDYLTPAEMTLSGGPMFADTGPVRAIDLGRAIQRR